MTPYVTRFLEPQILSLFTRVREAIVAMPDIDLGRDPQDGRPILVSCHHVARAVSELFPPLQCVDGKFFGGWEHSWCKWETEGVVLDVYPVALFGGPVLVDGNWGSPWKHLYKPCALGHVVRRERFDHQVRMVTEALRSTSSFTGEAA